MHKWFILDKDMNFVMSFKSYDVAIQDAKQAATEIGESFFVVELKSSVTPETWVRIDVL